MTLLFTIRCFMGSKIDLFSFDLHQAECIMVYFLNQLLFVNHTEHGYMAPLFIFYVRTIHIAHHTLQ